MTTAPSFNAAVEIRRDAPSDAVPIGRADAQLRKIMWPPVFGREPLDVPKVEIDRGGGPGGRWKKPKVVPPGGNQVRLYYRPSKIGDAIGYAGNLIEWNENKLLIGAGIRPDLAELAVAHRDDKDRLEELREECKDAGGAHDAANRGNASHRVLEKLDFGIPTGPLPPRIAADAKAYTASVRGLEMVAGELFMVHDGHKVGGSTDRVVYYQGRYYILDLKTAGTMLALREWVIQLAIYSRSVAYDWILAEYWLEADKRKFRTDADQLRAMPFPIDQERAIIVHVPQGTGHAMLYWVDLHTGWHAAERAIWAKTKWQSKSTLDNLITPFTPVAPPTHIDISPARPASGNGHTAPRQAAPLATWEDRRDSTVPPLSPSAQAALGTGSVPDSIWEDPDGPLGPTPEQERYIMTDVVLAKMNRAPDEDALKAVYAAHKDAWCDEWIKPYQDKRTELRRKAAAAATTTPTTTTTTEEN